MEFIQIPGLITNGHHLLKKKKEVAEQNEKEKSSCQHFPNASASTNIKLDYFRAEAV